MATDGRYDDPGPTRAEIDATREPVALEFGADWCGICQGARPLIEAAAASSPRVRHIKVADGPGRPLGRSFRIKLWPTLVFLRDGQEVARVVRPQNEDDVRRGFEAVGNGRKESEAGE